MSTPHVPSDDELDDLTIDKASYAVPEPTPQVVERIHEVAKRIKDGELVSSVAEDGVDKIGGVKVVALTEFSREDKLSYIAHILHGKPFIKRFDLLGGALKIDFEGISGDVDRAISELAQSDPHPPARKARYINYLMAASLKRLEVEGKAAEYSFFRDGEDNTRVAHAYETWVSSLNRETYRLLRDCFRDFRKTMNELARRARDADFWPTP